MSRKKKFSVGYFFAHLFIVTILIFSIIKFRSEEKAAPAFETVKPIATLVASPVTLIISAFHTSTEYIVDFVMYKRRIADVENELLNGLILSMQNRHLENQNKDLRAILQSGNNVPPSYTIVQMHHVIQNGIVERAEINAGEDSRVQDNSLVVVKGYVFGRVYSILQEKSYVILLNDIRSRVPAVTKTSGVMGLVYGNGINTRFVPMFDTDVGNVINGETVVTSSMNGIVKPDFLIGRISKGNSTNGTEFDISSVDYKNYNKYAILVK